MYGKYSTGSGAILQNTVDILGQPFSVDSLSAYEQEVMRNLERMGVGLDEQAGGAARGALRSG